MWIKYALISLLFIGGVSNASAQGLFGAIRNGDLKTVKKIVQAYPDSINAKSDQQFSALMISCYRGQSKIAIWLVKNGADVNAFSPEGTALQAAVYKNEIGIAKALIQKKAELNLASPDGNNALIYAVLNGNKAMVDLLLKAGADKNFKNKDGQTALSLAQSLNHTDICVLLSK